MFAVLLCFFSFIYVFVESACTLTASVMHFEVAAAESFSLLHFHENLSHVQTRPGSVGRQQPLSSVCSFPPLFSHLNGNICLAVAADQAGVCRVPR